MSQDIPVCEGEEHADYFPQENLHNLQPQNYPPHVLRICPGAIVMLIKNMSVSEGLCNGTRLIVERINDTSIVASILYGPHANRRFMFTRMQFANVNDATQELKFTRFQFPFKVAFCMTINKAQGQTLQKVGVMLKQPVFAHGQLYVALSRATCFANVRVAVPECRSGNDRQGVFSDNRTYTKNIVYPEVFKD